MQPKVAKIYSLDKREELVEKLNVGKVLLAFQILQKIMDIANFFSVSLTIYLKMK